MRGKASWQKGGKWHTSELAGKTLSSSFLWEKKVEEKQLAIQLRKEVLNPNILSIQQGALLGGT